jgi:hydrogenase-4 membrane subunit HyfE
VEAGVFLDVLVVVLVAEGLVMQIRDAHATLDVDLLRELRG